MMPGLGLRHAAPERYGTLEHPGDAFSFDIFTQVARAVRGCCPSDTAFGLSECLQRARRNRRFTSQPM